MPTATIPTWFQDAAFLQAHGLLIQCAGCGEGLLTADPLLNPEPADPDGIEVFAVPCPSCSEKLGKRVVIPVAILVGRQVEALEEAEAGDCDEPPVPWIDPPPPPAAPAPADVVPAELEA